MELETAFYIVGLIFMGLMLIITVAIAIAVLVIRAKIVSIHKAIDDKIHGVTDMASKVGDLFRATKQAVSGK